jgi:hypothetical protein
VSLVFKNEEQMFRLLKTKRQKEGKKMTNVTLRIQWNGNSMIQKHPTANVLC